MNKQRLLIIEKGQLGHLVDAVKWCEYLQDEYLITYVGYDMGNKHPSGLTYVRERYVSAKFPKAIRGTLLLLLSLLSVFFHRGKIMVVYFPKCQIIKRLIPWKKMLLDIRTLSVNPDKTKRQAYNKEVVNTCKHFDLITAISQGIADKLNLQNVYILPLGADRISNKRKNYTNSIRLLYVGTFEGRNIDKTVEGVGLFRKIHPHILITYTIIGSGRNHETELFERLIAQYHLEDVVRLEGRIPHHELHKYFDQANIGVSFVPIIDYYQYQPPTKTFEYVMSGLFCIATNTFSNAEIITSKSGILIEDSAEAFAWALEEYWNKKDVMRQDDIKRCVDDYTWSHIVETHLKPVLNLLQ